MRFIITVRELLDLISEEVAIRTGLLLTDHEARAILAESDMKEWLGVFDLPPDEQKAVRAEFVDDMVRVIRAGVGELPDATPGHVVAIRALKDLDERGHDTGPIIEAIASEIKSPGFAVFGEDAVKRVAEKCGAAVSVVAEVVMLLFDWADRSLWYTVRSEEWDGNVALADLFNTESVPEDPGCYLDQRFLDYLAVNPDRVDEIHWRNFERLCAEFFQRHHYHVQLGPGTADGGIDIRVSHEEDSASGPPLMIVQCKRYREPNVVQVEYVKALWADVVFEKAQRGLIATTSRIAPAGKRVAHARKWPLSFAESDRVRQYSKSMWRHSWRGKGKTSGIGRYLLPPILPL